MKPLLASQILSFLLVSPLVHAQEARPEAAGLKSTFQLFPNPKFLGCLSASKGTPTAKVTVVQGKLNDTLTLSLSHVTPNLDFDLFTIQRSNLTANGQADPAFTTFGLAWYQSDVQADRNGNAKVKIQTILVNQIFGFDPDAPLAPTNTFHVGLWFDNPADAAAAVSPAPLPSTGRTTPDLTR